MKETLLNQSFMYSIHGNGIDWGSNSALVKARLISTNRFRGHILLNISYKLQEVTKLGCNLLWLPVSFLQRSVPFVTMKMNVYL